MFTGLSRLLLGSPLPTSEESHQRLTKVKALAVFSSDALSSVAYAPEEILLALAVGGSMALGLSLPIALAITVLLAIVATSYYQTIHGYPSGGGAYIVAHDNLGAWPGLTAAAALLIDYVLVVAVSTSAGVAAIASASGTTALTGVEAISNGIPAFEKPESENAGKTLIAMSVLLASMFMGIVLLIQTLGIEAIEQETVLSQVGRRVFGKGPLYLILQAAAALILLLAANTSFADFPRLSAILARDRYLPRQLANLGDRLVFSNGIAALAILASILVIAFGGSTHRLIPLYAVGVFLSFTLSQVGMVRHWRRDGGPGWA